MIKYPLHFSAKSEAPAGIHQTWVTTDSGERSVTCAIPPEFEGPGGGFSPEDFFALAAMNCFIATFKVIAEKSRVEFASIRTRGNLVVDRDERGAPWMKAMEIQVELDPGGGDRERLKHLLEKTSKSCIVANSIKSEVRFDLRVLGA